MRSYCAVYVDAGYLLAASATRVTGSSLRSGIKVDHAGLISGLIAQAVEASGLPILRLHWYDSAGGPNGAPDQRQEQIGLLKQVKIRLGRLSPAGEQKGVDLRIGLDLVNHSRNRNVDVMYLVSGDDDLTEAVEEAQSFGAQVVVLAVPDERGNPHGVARHLERAADDLLIVDAATVDRAVSREIRTPAAPTDRIATPADLDAAAPARAATSGRAASAEPAVPSPATLARRSAAGAPTPGVPAPAAPALGVSAPGVPAPSGASAVYSTGPEGVAYSERVDVIEDVARTVAANWREAASDAEYAELMRKRPTIPGELDRALLVDLSARLGVYDLDEWHRHDVRDAFWDQLEAR